MYAKPKYCRRSSTSTLDSYNDFLKLACPSASNAHASGKECQSLIAPTSAALYHGPHPNLTRLRPQIPLLRPPPKPAPSHPPHNLRLHNPPRATPPNESHSRRPHRPTVWPLRQPRARFRMPDRAVQRADTAA